MDIPPRAEATESQPHHDWWHHAVCDSRLRFGSRAGHVASVVEPAGLFEPQSVTLPAPQSGTAVPRPGRERAPGGARSATCS
jgi:hypothetical protein